MRTATCSSRAPARWVTFWLNLIKAKTKIKRVRADTLGYLQRSFLGCVSATDASEAREVGEKAVQFAAWHNVDGSVAIRAWATTRLSMIY